MLILQQERDGLRHKGSHAANQMKKAHGTVPFITRRIQMRQDDAYFMCVVLVGDKNLQGHPLSFNSAPQWRAEKP